MLTTLARNFKTWVHILKFLGSEVHQKCAFERVPYGNLVHDSCMTGSCDIGYERYKIAEKQNSENPLAKNLVCLEHASSLILTSF